MIIEVDGWYGEVALYLLSSIIGIDISSTTVLTVAS